MSLAGENRAIAHSAAGIYAGAMVMGLAETAIPGGPEFSVIPGVVALVLAPRSTTSAATRPAIGR
jgi:hypothetical protein